MLYEVITGEVLWPHTDIIWVTFWVYDPMVSQDKRSPHETAPQPAETHSRFFKARYSHPLAPGFIPLMVIKS